MELNSLLILLEAAEYLERRDRGNACPIQTNIDRINNNNNNNNVGSTI